MSQNTHAIRAARVYCATGEPPIDDGVVLIHGGKIAKVGVTSELTHDLSGIEVTHFPEGTIIPGLIDAHAHLTLAGDGRTYEEMVTDPDEMMALVSIRNLQRHLRSGVTTIRDNGGRNRVPFVVREAINRGYFAGPRLLLSGRPVTHSGGHFHWCNGVADTHDQIRAAVRVLVADGADHIKIMASGGATAGNYPHYPSYTTAEMRTAVEAAHQLGRLTTAHCRSTSSITNALDAGLDCIEHAGFLEPRASRLNSQMDQSGIVKYDRLVAKRLVDSGKYVSYTLQSGGYDTLVDLRTARDQRELTDTEQLTLQRLEGYFETKLEIFHDLISLGLAPRLVISTDAGPLDIQFGRMHYVFELAIRGGMTPTQALDAATRIAAEACGLSSVLGTISESKYADLVVVDGNPLQDVADITRIAAVILGGEKVV